MKERVVIFIVARLGSSRLPQKQLRLIGDKPLLAWAVHELKRCREVDEIVIATLAGEENDPLRHFAQKEGISCFSYEGEVDRVTTRLRVAAESFRADIPVLISGDWPLFDAPLIDQQIRLIKHHPDANVLRLIPPPDGKICAMGGVSIYRTSAWQQADDQADPQQPWQREHHFPLIYLRPHEYRFCELQLRQLLIPPARLTVDTTADLEFFQTIYLRLQEKGLPFTLPHTVDLLLEHPELTQINAHVYQRQLIEVIPQVLIIMDCGHSLGYGHLMRSTALGKRLMEQLGWPVTFLVDDSHAVDLLQNEGLEVRWGSIGRAPHPQPPSHSAPLLSTAALASFDLIIADLYPRDLPFDWKKGFQTEAVVVAIDSFFPWTRETDLIVIPSLLYHDLPAHPHPPCIYGAHLVIIRKEIRQAKTDVPSKDIDILIYFHNDRQRAELTHAPPPPSWKVVTVDGTNPDFPHLLARAKIYIGNFGYSFYEALYLNTLPCSLPVSERHREEAITFYQQLSLPNASFHPKIDFPQLLLQFNQNLPPPDLEQGAGNIVEAIQQLLKPKT
ncbi:MAG: hypothetical protein HQL48_00495 [Gammaproteobacteria bacterium]|nr:hypothetical protein [Gammaproteobacteria bacterium]